MILAPCDGWSVRPILRPIGAAHGPRDMMPCAQLGADKASASLRSSMLPRSTRVGGGEPPRHQERDLGSGSKKGGRFERRIATHAVARPGQIGTHSEH